MFASSSSNDAPNGIGSLELIALTEAICFDDLEFAPLVREILVTPSQHLHGEYVALTVQNGTKRVVFEPAGRADDEQRGAFAREVVFVVVPGRSAGLSHLSRIGEKFERRMTSSAHVCLLYLNHGYGTELMASLRDYLSGGVEWRDPSPDAPGACGLLFSSGWNKGVACHVAGSLEKYARELSDRTRSRISLLHN
ncbi:hypothetical protein WKR88_15575 [Trinickia caryophylli]|uniref:Uncharacterized protein n=1 Tax=Trinickia caryophylli TaxID=28094 RepID=A0A1X7D447_TRICW|nr:hypothetical protein [Trinickia caryophylli]PMS12755.1 hypothetical protein C0Z17_07980 [Trinickia caryophylli]TRX15163.1 hypothetical protein FNF07_28645 [Trinickia caryophylli]WQE15027.1 hypothetical protein U0034_20970 [Trinickia caryophylli]SMF08498.1 hypothetical protein SAMN06295900_102366 [Trinickia caryophylli]GLU31240.1 hypothetical protein Busp01_10820 [Trinickia caryophylli]